MGAKSVRDKAVAMGIPADAPDLAPTPALTLGPTFATPLTMATVYGVFADGGVRNDPVMVSAVKDWKGAVVWQPGRRVAHVLSAKTADQVTDVLRGTLTDGTAAGSAEVRALGARGLAGKAGTNDGITVAWFDGYSPDLVVSMNLTNPQGEDQWGALKGDQTSVYGSTVVAPIWAKFMEQVSH